MKGEKEGVSLEWEVEGWRLMLRWEEDKSTHARFGNLH